MSYLHNSHKLLTSGKWICEMENVNWVNSMELIPKHCISWTENSASVRWRCRKFYKNVARANCLQLSDLIFLWPCVFTYKRHFIKRFHQIFSKKHSIIFFKTDKSVEKASQVKLTRSWIRFQNVASEQLVTEI